MKGDSVSNSTDGPDIDGERVYRTVLVKSLPPSTSKQNLIIHFQFRKNGGGDIEELRLLDRGSAVITFEEEKVAKSVQKKEQRFNGVLLTVEQYNVQPKEMENLQVFSKVSAMIDPTKLGLTMQETQALLKQIGEETKVDFGKPQNKHDVFILTGSFQQIQKSHRLLFHHCLSKAADSKRKETSKLKDQPKGMMNGNKSHMNGAEEPSVKEEAKSASRKANGSATTTSNHFSKSSKESSTSEKKGYSYDSSLKYSKKDKTEIHTEKLPSKSSVKHLSSYGTRTSGETQGSFKISSLNEKGSGPKGADGLSSGGKDKSENKKESSISGKEETDCTQKVEISSKAWYVFVKIYEKELQSVMTHFSVKIEPEDNHSVAIIKPSGEYNKEKLKIAGEELKRLYEEASSKMKLVRFVLADPANKEHDSMLRKTVLQVKKDSPVFLERADDRQSWEIFGEIDQVEKGMKLLKENVKLEKKELDVDVETIEETDSEEESDDADKETSDGTEDSNDDVDEDDDDLWNEKLEQQLGKVKVSVYRGDITEEKCDAIVNAANESLDHAGGVARTIVSKGGPAIQDACNRIVNSKGKLKVGDAAVSHSGILKCKMIIHAVGPNWKNDKGEKGKALLKKACKESLFQAEKYSFTSIAFPAISSGIFGMPKNICAQVMFDVAEEYSKSVTSSGAFGLRDIRFVNNDFKTVKIFRNEFKTRYGSGKVIPESRRDSKESDDHSAYAMSENPASMRGNSKPFKMSPTWKAESKKDTTEKHKTNAFEPSKHSDKIPSRERHSSSQENGLSLAPRGGRPEKEYPSQPLADNMGKNSRFFQTGRGKAAHIESMEKESKNPTHSSKHAIVKSYSFTGGARPKQTQGQFSKDKMHTEHLLASPSSIETKDDVNKCSICLNKMKHPKTLPRCNHTFCRTCLEKAVQQSPKCPYCREPLTDRQDSPTHGQGRNGYRADEFAYSGLNRYDDNADDATLCLICAKPVRQPKTLPCRHTFCTPCIDRAFREYSACPCCSELERNQPSTHSWNQDPYDQQSSNFPRAQGWMDMDVSQGAFPPAFRREQPRSNRGNRPTYTQNFDGYQEQFSFPGTTTRRGQPGRGTQPKGSMRDRQEKFSLPGYDEYGTIVIQYSFMSGQQGPDHPNPGFRYESTSRSAYLPDCPEGRNVLKLLRKAFDAGLLFKIGRSMTSNLDNQIIWADIPHKTSTSGGASNYGYPDPTYLSEVKQQLQAALKGR